MRDSGETVPYESAGTAGSRSASILRTLAYMRSHLNEALSLQQLAGVAGLSIFQFNALFRREVGMPPYRYLSQLRIGAAQQLLREGMPVAMVAAEAGFFDQPHLYRHFRRVCGVTPGQYLASMLNEHALSDAR